MYSVILVVDDGVLSSLVGRLSLAASAPVRMLHVGHRFRCSISGVRRAPEQCAFTFPPIFNALQSSSVTASVKPASAAAMVLWFHGLGDSGRGWAFLEGAMRLPGVRWSFPDAPRIFVTINGGPSPAWFDMKGARLHRRSLPLLALHVVCFM